MKIIIIFWCMLLCINSFIECVIYKSNFTDLKKCEISYSRSGDTYIQYYPVVNPESGQENNSLVLDFHFAVLATSDAHILLTESEKVNKTDPAYEIVIGAGGNTFSDIRRMQKSDVKQSVVIKGLLSAVDPRFFWIHITNGGSIEVGKEGENTSFISWLDPKPLSIKFISFSTWSDIEAKWYFNCDRSLNEEELNKRRTALERLRRDLLIPYDPLVRPVMNQSTITEVYIGLTLEHLEFDDNRAILDLRGAIIMRWHDEKLNWHPNDYENVTKMYTSRNEIWRPELQCYSSINNGSSILQDAILQIDYKGNVLWQPPIHIQGLCYDLHLGDWPMNIHGCEILLNLSIEDSRVVFNINSTASQLFYKGSQWLFLEKSIFQFKSDNSSEKFNTMPNSFGIYFEIKRNSVIYSVVFLLPLVVIALCLLTSFWAPLIGNFKLFLAGLQLFIEIIILLALAHFIPHTTDAIPFLIILYGWCLAGSFLSILISLILMKTFSKTQSKPVPHVICKILTKKWVKFFLILPNVGVPEDYGDIDISLSFSNVSRTEDKSLHVWGLLLLAIERLLFMVYSVFVATILTKYVMSCF